MPVELASEYFDVGRNARFLATVGRVRDAHRKTFESAVLGDGLVRVHTVDPQENPLFHKLLLSWGRKTGLPVLYNTSFNLFGDPLVCTPRDAVRSFYSSGIDAPWSWGTSCWRSDLAQRVGPRDHQRAIPAGLREEVGRQVDQVVQEMMLGSASASVVASYDQKMMAGLPTMLSRGTKPQ